MINQFGMPKIISKKVKAFTFIFLFAIMYTCQLYGQVTGADEMLANDYHLLYRNFKAEAGNQKAIAYSMKTFGLDENFPYFINSQLLVKLKLGVHFD